MLAREGNEEREGSREASRVSAIRNLISNYCNFYSKVAIYLLSNSDKKILYQLRCFVAIYFLWNDGMVGFVLGWFFFELSVPDFLQELPLISIARRIS